MSAAKSYHLRLYDCLLHWPARGGRRYYRRLLQTGVQTTELWSNLGLCTFYSGQYDMTLACFDRALGLADGEAL